MVSSLAVAAVRQAETFVGVQDAGIDLPAAAWLQQIGACVKQDAVVALVPALKATLDVCLGGARFKPHVGVRKVVVQLVVLRWKVISLRLALVPDELREGVALVHMVRDGTHVVEELAQQVPAAFALEDFFAQ